jgi:hypothetical protein
MLDHPHRNLDSSHDHLSNLGNNAIRWTLHALTANAILTENWKRFQREQRDQQNNQRFHLRKLHQTILLKLERNNPSTNNTAESN